MVIMDVDISKSLVGRPEHVKPPCEEPLDYGPVYLPHWDQLSRVLARRLSLPIHLSI